jgi:UDP-N-acetylglucosamine 2-epimerase (non-hydrolysing)
MKIISVVGTRPNFMKVTPIISAIKEHNRRASNRIDHLLVHTGQHYDQMMSGAFFDDLDLSSPDIFLGIGSGSHAFQTAEIMKKFENIVESKKPDVVIIVGDVNSTLACALAASKVFYDSNGSRPLIAHVEAGLRSFDRSMPEEINRILTDHISDFLFVTEESGITNLRNEGISSYKIQFVGNTMIDTLLAFHKKADESTILKRLGLVANKEPSAQNSILPYALLTLHRPSNVDNIDNLLSILEALDEFKGRFIVVFPVHPRTKKRIKEFGLSHRFTSNNSAEGSGKGIRLINPLGYLDFLCLMKRARIVLTDSGGIQEETTCFGVPCVTIRANTERPVTVTNGTNVLAGLTKEQIVRAVEYQLGRRLETRVPELWDGRAAARIIDIIVRKADGR